MRAYATNIVKAIGTGLGVATLLTAWITFLRITVGAAPFTANETTYSATVAVYYAGGAIGGLLVGVFFPLRRWVFGYAILGMLAAFPVYLGVALASTSRSNLLSDENLFFAIFASVTAGGAAGILWYLKDHKTGPSWLEALRHPTPRTIIGLWTGAVVLAAVGYFGVSQWTGHASWVVQVIAAVAFFVGPLGLAALVTAARYSKGKELNW